MYVCKISPKKVCLEKDFFARSSLINFWKILRCHSQVDKDQSRPLSAFGNSLCMIFTILLTFLGKSCNAHMLHTSGVYYIYMVSGPNFEFRKAVCNFWHQDICFSLQNGKNDGFTKMSVESWKSYIVL